MDASRLFSMKVLYMYGEDRTGSSDGVKWLSIVISSDHLKSYVIIITCMYEGESAKCNH